MIRSTLAVCVAVAALWAAPAHASTWCGTPAPADRSPNVVAGFPVHMIYAIPSDGQDRLSQLGTQMQTDAELIDGWWRGQDPSRTVRFDLFPFPCGAQLDITSVRLPQSGAQLAAREGRFQTIASTLFGFGFGSQYVKYVVYYDGPVADASICGTGGGGPDEGPAYAITFVNACAGIQTALVAAHELVHALGAVPDAAPHECPPPNGGHVCDSTQDIMYPFATGAPLSALVLDVGRDDYYGHSGSWFDVQDSKWLVQVDRQVPLSLAVAGQGAVVSDVPGLLCTASCQTGWNAGTQLALTATAAEGMRFVRWSGACAGSSTCSLRLDAAEAVSALFAPATFTLSVAVAGKGVVRSSPAAIACKPRCSAALTSYVPVTLQATATKGWRFKRWSGACAGKPMRCRVPMTADSLARAVFVRR